MSRISSVLSAFSISSLFALSAHAATVIDLNHNPSFSLVGFQKADLASPSLSITSNNTNTLQPLMQSVDRMGTVHTRYQQYFRGIPVWGKQVITHTPAAAATYVSGTLVQDIAADVSDLSPAPGFDSTTALKGMQQRYLTRMASVAPKANWAFNNTKVNLVYYLDAHQTAHLAYAVTFFVDAINQNRPANPFYIVDAKTKMVLAEWDDLKFEAIGTGPGGNEKTGYYTYGDVHQGTNYGFLDVTCNLGICVMENPTVETINLKGAKVGIIPYYYRGTEHDGTDKINGAISPLNDAHFFGSVIFNMYKDWYNTTPLNGQLKLKPHYGHGYENAFYSPITNAMYFGDGADKFYPLVALDVVGHEVSHGFTNHHSGLAGGMSESAAMNEAFSDMAGKAAEFYMRGHNGWEVGADIFKDPQGAIRYMDNPPKDGHSIDDARQFDATIDPHYGAGVYNKAFYKLATSPGWNTRKAFDVMEAANDHFWQPDSDFVTGATGVVKAAQELKYNVADVIAAFDSVGVACSEIECKLKPA